MLQEHLEKRIVLSGYSADAITCCCPVCMGVLDETPIVASAPIAPIDDTFLLNSLPGADHTIYLDFNGHTTSGTIWNAFYANGQNFNSPAFNFEGSASSFTDNELATIQRIWARTAEAFSPFNVNVTTQDPGIEALRKTENDSEWGVRIVIGGSSTQWYGSLVGGVAFVGSFNMNSDTPVYVFPSQLGGGSSDKNVAGAAIHEAGHSLGLNHHGTISQEYYSGHGTGETSWAPIMGNPYSRNLNHWSKGEYPNANNSIQDDLAIITSQNGFGYKSDDYTSIEVLRVNPDKVISGTIETRHDTDTIGFIPSSWFTITVSPASIGTMLDISIELLDWQFNVISTSNPRDSLSATVSHTPQPEIGGEPKPFYIRIDGYGKDGEYSDYSSIGEWKMKTHSQNAAPPIERNRIRDWALFTYDTYQ